MTAFLQCDTDGCDHSEFVPAITRDLIGKQCPKCGANLLTEDDCDNFLTSVMPAVELAKTLGILVSLEGQPTADQVVTKIHLHEDALTVQVGPAAKIGLDK